MSDSGNKTQDILNAYVDGVMTERERIIKLLEEQDYPLMKKLMAVENDTWESHSIAGQRMGFLMAIALIKGENK